MQAIILAAGMGKRLGELTRDNTKCMVKVNGKSLIDRYLETLSGRGLARVIIVTGYKGRELRDYIGDRYANTLKIEYIDNPVYDRTNNIYSLSLAKKELCEDDTLLLESDLIFETGMLDLLMESLDPDVALVAKYETWMDGTMVRIDDERNIVNFIPKADFRQDDAATCYKTVNIYKFSKEFCRNKYVPFLEAYSKVMGNNEYYEQVLRVLTIVSDTSLKALPVEGFKWYEIDDIQDLDIASTLFSDGKVKYNEYRKRFGGFWRFPQMMDFRYQVNPYFPTARMKAEIKANMYDLLTRYPSGMLVNSLLAGKYFGIRQEYITVGNGASEIIRTVMDMYRDEKVGIVFPTFDEYPNRLRPENIVPFVCSSPDFQCNADELMTYWEDKNISLIVLVNPGNPSGQLIPKADLLRLIEWSKSKDIGLLIDESFVDFADEECGSLLDNDILRSYKGLYVIRSISKSYGVPGLRLGVLASSDVDFINKLKKETSIWNINSFAEFYLQIFGKYEKDYVASCNKFKAERAAFFKELQAIPYLRVIPSQASYFMCEVTSGFTSAELTEKLIEKDVLISDCGLKRQMDGKQYVRISVRSHSDNCRLISILKEI